MGKPPDARLTIPAPAPMMLGAATSAFSRIPRNLKGVHYSWPKSDESGYDRTSQSDPLRVYVR